MSEHDVSGIIEKYKGDSSALIAILQDVQEEYRHLPQDTLTQIADNLSIPLSRTYSLATFFKAFSLEPRGKYAVNVCLGTACHVRGGAANPGEAGTGPGRESGGDNGRPEFQPG